MTSVRDEGLWITDGRNGGPDGQTNQGAAAAGAAAGLAEGVSRLFGGKTPQQKYSDLVRHSEEIYARETKAYNERREEKVFRDKLPKDERLYHFRDNAKYVTWGQLPQKVKDRRTSRPHHVRAGLPRCPA